MLSAAHSFCRDECIVIGKGICVQLQLDLASEAWLGATTLREMARCIPGAQLMGRPIVVKSKCWQALRIRPTLIWATIYLSYQQWSDKSLGYGPICSRRNHCSHYIFGTAR